MTKRRIKNLCRFGVILALILILLSNFLMVGNLLDGIRIRGFYMEPKNSLDVVTLGASETYTSISPGLLWKDYGFTSYNYSIAGNPISLMKTQIKEVLKHQNPRIIVIEVNGAVPHLKDYQLNDNKMHSYLDNIPWSENKVEAINELVAKKEQYSYYLPFMKYHSNWKNLDQCVANLYLRVQMQLAGGTKLKGFQTISKYNDNKLLCKDILGDTSKSKLTPSGEYYLRDLLSYLREQNINNVLFIRIPHRVTTKTYGDYKRSNHAGEIIKEYGYDFVNFEQQREFMNLDNENDFYNDSHMNINGQKKFTDYFGKYLTRRYHLNTIEHSEEIVKRWNDAANETMEALNYTESLMKENKARAINEGWRAVRRFNIKKY